MTPIYQSKPDLPKAIVFWTNAILDHPGFLPNLDWSAVWSRLSLIFGQWKVNVCSRNFKPVVFQSRCAQCFVSWASDYELPTIPDAAGAAKERDFLRQDDFTIRPARVWVSEIPAELRSWTVIADVIGHEIGHLAGCSDDSDIRSVMNARIIPRSAESIPVFGELNQRILDHAFGRA